MKTYLDNNVVSALAKDDTASESASLDRLLAAYESGTVELVTSEITLREIKSYVGRGRMIVERTFRLLEKIPVTRWDELLGIRTYSDKFTCINRPVIENDILYDSLLQLGLKEADAQHVFVAAKQGCTVFLTCDGGVIARANNIRKLCGLVVEKPSDLVAREGW
jgi:predicted nucleic acid-binding protein